MFEDMISDSARRWEIIKCVIFFLPDNPFSEPHPHATNECPSKEFLGLHSLQAQDDYY